MNEERYAYRIRQALNHGAKDIPPAAARRLEAARHLALAKQKRPVAVMALAGTNATTSLLQWVNDFHLKQILAIIALLLGMWISFYWHSTQYVAEIEDVDSALLTEDIPPDAFLDKDFFEWLKDDSSED